MKRCLLICSVILAVVEQSQSSCGSASCPLNNHRYLQAGLFRVGFAREYIDQNRIFIGSQPSFVGAISYHHDEVETINERSILQLQVGLFDRLGFNLDVPFITRQHSHIHHHQGQDLWESWSFSGMGDAIVSAQYALALPKSDFDPYVAVVFGLKMPTGVTDIKNAEGEEAEVSIQPGTGSTDGIVGFHYRQTILSLQTLSGDYSALPLNANVSYQFNGAGKDGWKFGNTLLAHVGTAYQFSHKATLMLQLNGRFQDFADVGSTGEPRENTGGAWFYVSPGLNVEITEDIKAFGFVQLPLYQKVNGIQQTSAFNLQFGISADVGLLD